MRSGIPLSLLLLGGIPGCQLFFSETAPVNYIGPGDFDRDGIANVDDPCPTSAGINDQDQDGLPDNCDPARTVAGDCLVFFDGFTNRTNDLDPRWVSDGGSPRVLASGALTFAADSNSAGILQFNLSVAADHVTVDGQFTSQAAGEFFAGVALSYQQLSTLDSTLFGGAYSPNSNTATALAGSTFLVAQKVFEPRTSPTACLMPPALPFTGTMSIKRLAAALNVSIEPSGAASDCGQSRAIPVTSNKIVLGLVNAKASLNYVLATRRLAPGQFCAHSNQTM